MKCPVCGTIFKPEPTGEAWVLEEDGTKTYISNAEAPQSNWCWTIRCPDLDDECGINITADTREEAINLWEDLNRQIRLQKRNEIF